MDWVCSRRTVRVTFSTPSPTASRTWRVHPCPDFNRPEVVCAPRIFPFTTSCLYGLSLVRIRFLENSSFDTQFSVRMDSTDSCGRRFPSKICAICGVSSIGAAIDSTVYLLVLSQNAMFIRGVSVRSGVVCFRRFYPKRGEISWPLLRR